MSYPELRLKKGTGRHSQIEKKIKKTELFQFRNIMYWYLAFQEYGPFHS